VKIAYLSTDEVNQDLAARLAADCRVVLDPVLPRDPAPNGEYDAVVYDLDSWPQPERGEVLSRLANDTHHAVAVHSYSLEDDQVEAFRGQGASVHRRLDAEIFKVLRAMMRSQTEARCVQVAIGGRTPALESA
jgi:plasmid stability protein